MKILALLIIVATLSGCGISADLGRQIGDPSASFVAGARRGVGVEVKTRTHAAGGLLFIRRLNETLEIEPN